MSEPHTSGEHGKRHGTPSSWAVVALILVSVVVGGIALILHIMWLLFVCAGLFLAGIPLGALAKIMDDTVAYTLPPGYQPHTPVQPHPANPGTPVDAPEPAPATGSVDAADPVGSADPQSRTRPNLRSGDRQPARGRSGEAGSRHTQS